MKYRRIFAALALCFLLATQYHIGNHIICFPEPTDDFQAFQFLPLLIIGIILANGADGNT